MPTTGTTKRFLRRLGQKSWAELRFRSRQELLNRWEGLLYRLGAMQPTDGRALFAEKPAPAAGRFFFSLEELPLLAGVLRTRLPEAAQETIERAERACAHRFDLLGYPALDFGPQIDWHLDPVHNKRAPRKLWYQIPYLDFETAGDVKITWELNRHQHFVVLGKAYQLTGAEKYPREFAAQFYDWQRQNPYPIGVNWASSLEVAFRSLSWLWARELFANSASLTAEFRRKLVAALDRNARFIERNLSIYFSPNTHLLGEAVALFFVGVLCPELRSAARWQALGWKIVLEEAQRQVRADGGYFEQATYYHVYALDFLLHARILAARNQIAIPPELDRTIVAMLEYLAALGVAGPPPRFGDDDGGRVFDPRRSRAEHLLDPLSTGAVLFGRGAFKAAAETLREETLWLLGPSAAAEFDRLPAAREDASSRAFAETGTYVLASPGLRLAVDAGPMGTSRGGHGHADALSVCVAADGREWMGDPGTFTYTGSREWRNEFRSTRAHNTLVVDGRGQAEPVEPFAWSRLAEARVERWLAGETFDLLVASHDGYLRLASPVRHRRLVFFVKGRFWLVVDTAEGKGKHRLELFWHSPAEQVELGSENRAVARNGDEGFGVVALRDSNWSVERSEGWWAECYGARQPAKVLRCSAEAELPVEFATLLVPRVVKTEDLGCLEALRGNRRDVRGYGYRAESQRHVWVLAETREAWQVGELTSDARVMYCAQDAAGQVEQVILCDATFLAIGGERVLEADRRCARLEYRLVKGRGEVFCSEGAAVRGPAENRQIEMASVGTGQTESPDWT